MRQIKVTDPESAQLFTLQLAVHELNTALSDAGKDPALLESRTGGLCRPRMSMAELVTLPAEALGAVLRTCAEPVKVKKMKGKDGEDDTFETVVSPSLPIRLVKAYMGTKDWPGVPTIKQIARAPIVRPDFTVRWDPGWDEATGCWVLPGLERDESLLGMDMRNVFKRFAFARPEFVIDMLAAALTPYMTTAIDAPYPALLVVGTEAGSGKTFAAQVAGTLGNCGAEPAVTSWKSTSHMTQTVISAVNSDERLTIFDNIKHDIDSPMLESVITSRRLSERGYNTQVNLRLRSNTSWSMTANGASVSQDMARRSIVTLLDKRLNPVEWDASVMPWVRANEAALVTCMVEMIEDWGRAGCVPGSLVYPGFEEWARAVSGILESAGYAGLFAAREDVLAENIATDDDDIAELINRIGEVMKEHASWRVGDLFNEINSYDRLIDEDCLFLRKWSDRVTVGKDQSRAMGWAIGKLVGKHVEGADWVIKKPNKQYVMEPCVKVRT